MKRKPFFSIILPTYNRESLVTQAIESALAQSFNDFELIIVDDGSTDNTKSRIKKFTDNRIKYFWKKNEERNIARNFGIGKSSGQFIGFLDSDDILYNDHLAHAHTFILEKNYPELIHLNFEVLNNPKKPSQLKGKHLSNLNKALINDNILSSNAIFIKKEILNKINFLESTNALIGEDHYLWLRLASRFKIHLSLQVTSAVRQHQERSLANIDVDKLILGTKEINDNLKQDRAFLDYYGWRANRYFAKNFIFLALQLVLVNRKKECCQYLFAAFNTYPLSLCSRRYLAVVKHLFLTK